MSRSTRNQSFCWQEKNILRSIKNYYDFHTTEKTARQEKAKMLFLYQTITWIDSDFNGKDINYYTKTIANYSGLSDRWIPKGLKKLESVFKVIKMIQTKNELNQYVKKEVVFTPDNLVKFEKKAVNALAVRSLTVNGSTASGSTTTSEDSLFQEDSTNQEDNKDMQPDKPTAPQQSGLHIKKDLKINDCFSNIPQEVLNKVCEEVRKQTSQINKPLVKKTQPKKQAVLTDKEKEQVKELFDTFHQKEEARTGQSTVYTHYARERKHCKNMVSWMGVYKMSVQQFFTAFETCRHKPGWLKDEIYQPSRINKAKFDDIRKHVVKEYVPDYSPEF